MQTKQNSWFFLAMTVFAMLLCCVAALFCYPPLLQTNYQSVGNFELENQTQKIDLNTADKRLLCLLPGVGEKKAAAIIAYRVAHGPFRELTDVQQVSGISEKTVREWQGLATVNGKENDGN